MPGPRLLLHPAPLAAAALLGLNDHILKATRFAGPITGKLSDVAGLFLAPIVLVALLGGALAVLGGARAARGAWLPLAACAAVALGFAALKLDPAVNALATRWWGANALDPTDLLCLPATALALLYLIDRRRAPAPPARAGLAPRFASVAALTATSLLCIATPAAPPRPPRPFPAWQVVADDVAEVGCARASVWVVRSGKTGVGVMVALATPAAPCRVALAAPTLAIDGAGAAIAPGALYRVPAVDTPPPRPVPLRTTPGGTIDLDLSAVPIYVYAGYAFDNEGLWNRGRRSGALAIELAADGARRSWRPRLVHRFVQPPLEGTR